jgi:hypothetical protein
MYKYRNRVLFFVIFYFMRSEYTGCLIIRRADIIKDAGVFQDIEKRRVAVRMSVSELCRRANVSRRAYYNWKNGAGIMPETLEDVTRALNSS